MRQEKRVPLPKAILIIALCFIAPFLLMAAATQLDLATQAKGILGKVNGGGADMSSVTFPGSGVIMTTSTSVAASQLPVPSASTLGGVESISCSAGSHVDSISTSGVPHCQADSVALNQGAPTGTINGSNTTFTLSPTPTAAADVNCFLNGIQQQQGAGNDYTISGATITYLTAPATGAKLNCLWF
jgi:hypothetical protein